MPSAVRTAVVMAMTATSAWDESTRASALKALIDVPKAHLVAVRQIRGDDYDDSKPWPNGYEDFTQRVIALAKTDASDLAVDTH